MFGEGEEKKVRRVGEGGRNTEEALVTLGCTFSTS